MKNILLIILAVTFLASCNKESIADEQNAKDEKIIQAYITENNLNALKGEDGLYYVIEVEGTGKKPNRTSTVGVRYKGYLTDGYVFDKSNSVATFKLGNVIKGWREGLLFFKEGGKGKLLIPSQLGYGSQSTSDIPSNSVLIFDIDLVAVF